MRDDVWLIAIVAAVWALLAVLYAMLPMLHMPGSTFVWGAGAIVFAVLAAAIGAAAKRRR